MATKINCLLCEGENLVEVGLIKRNDLIYLYKKLTGVNFEYLINDDIKLFECKDCGLKFFYPPISGDEKFYNSLQKFEWYYMDEKEEYLYAEKFICDNDKVLEVGCGKGAFAKIISSKTKNYIGLDTSYQAKVMANKMGIAVENYSIEEFAEKYPSAFDVVACFQVLEHTPNPKSFLEAMIKAAKPGGKLIIAVPNENSFLKYAINNILNMPPHHITRWCEKTFYYIAQKYGLNIESIYLEKVQPIHRVWFLSTLFTSLLVSPKLIDLSLKTKLITRLASFLSKLVASNLKEEMLPFGHTIVVVMLKKG